MEINTITVESWRAHSTMCRLCLQKDGFMLGIFNHIQGKDKGIYKKIIDCTALQISHGDGLPNVICHRCLYKIEFCLEFRKLCFISDATLRQLGAVVHSENQNGQVSPENQIQLMEQLAGEGDESVLIVDPRAADCDSNCESCCIPDSDVDNETADNNDFGDAKNVFMCKYCDRAFTDRSECDEHEMNDHDNDTPYSCGLCEMRFADRLQYSAHLKNQHQNDKPYNCPQCDRTFARRSDLRKHTVVHTGIKPYTCTVCSKSFSRNTNLSKHMRIHSGQKPFVCSKCPKTFFCRGDLNRHAAVHTGQKPFSCSYCHLGFDRKDKLARHEKKHMAQDIEEKPQELQMIPTPMNSYYETEENPPNQDESENMVISLDPFHHNDEFQDYPVKIEADAPKSDSPEESQRDLPHIPAHIAGDSFSMDNNKRFVCNSCPKTFQNPENMRYHQATHSGIRPHVCNVCKKTFIRKRELDRHFATHTGMKPFKCTKCSKSFGRKDKLVRHIRIHDVNKQHVCNVCGATFNRKDGLLQHKKTHQKNDPTDGS